MHYLLLVVFFLSISCKSERKVIQLGSKYYTDVNISSLEGTNKVEKNQYPNVEISDSANCRVLIYHIDSSNFIRRDYYRQDSVWVCSFSEVDDTANIYTIRLVYPDRLVEFSYTDTVRNIIYDVGVLEEDSMIYYKPKERYSRRLIVSDLEDIKRKTPYTVKFWHEVSSQFVKFYKEYNPQETGSESTVSTFLPKEDRSFFWWFETQYLYGGNVSK